jgi:hypothetical protein
LPHLTNQGFLASLKLVQGDLSYPLVEALQALTKPMASEMRQRFRTEPCQSEKQVGRGSVELQIGVSP